MYVFNTLWKKKMPTQQHINTSGFISPSYLEMRRIFDPLQLIKCPNDFTLINSHPISWSCYLQVFVPADHLSIISGVHVPAEVLVEVFQAIIEEDISLKWQ